MANRQIAIALNESDLPARESMDFDVVIVGAGPAGLATAIRLKQLAPDASVVVVEKGSEVGAHILSGAVVDPIGLDRLIPHWREDPERPALTPVACDEFYFLGPAGGVRLPNWTMPKLMNNHGNFVGSLGLIARYLGARAEALGVEIYPGFSGSELLYDAKGAVVGVATGDMGVGRDGAAKENYTRGMELRGRYTVLAEGARGSLSKIAIAKFGLDKNRDPQKYGIGLKEIWRIDPALHRPGLVQHSFGWPLDAKTGGGSFLYHFGEDLVSVGFVVHLNYENPTLSPFDEFQRFKTHPMIAPTFAGGKRMEYGARAITEGGWQSVPDLAFPGGVLVGCSAGFVNVPRIKGSHNAILSGMLAAEHISNALSATRAHDRIEGYEKAWRDTDIGKDLYRVRNVKPLWSKLGTYLGIAMGAADMWINQVFEGSPWTFRHGKEDCDCLKTIDKVKIKKYPKPDGKISFDKLSSVFISNTSHEEDQRVHLFLKDPSIPINLNLTKYGEPARLYCPAGVYEIIYEDEIHKKKPSFIINSQNCVHCKTCDIKDPERNITWTCPEGGGGPNYSLM